MSQRDTLQTDHYPAIYREYLKLEEADLVEYLQGAESVLDLGCGTGRLIPKLADLVQDFVGIDNNETYLTEAKQYEKVFSNVHIYNVDVADLGEKFPPGSFTKVFSAWNTVGCLENDRQVIKDVYPLVKEGFYFSVVAKGTLASRLEYYKSLGIPVEVDQDTEVISSSAWGKVKAYSDADIKDLVEGSGFTIGSIQLVMQLAYVVKLIK